MASYSVRLAKILLCCERFLGITFGGLQLRTLSNGFQFKTSKKWKYFGLLFIPITIAISVYRIVWERESFIHKADTIVTVLYFFCLFLYSFHCCALYVIFNCLGRFFFEFICRQQLTKKQYRICLLVLILPIVGILIRHVNWFTDIILTKKMTLKEILVSESLYLQADLAWAIGVSCQILISLFAYWNLKKISSEISEIQINQETQINQKTDINLKIVIKNFIELKNEFDKLDKIFRILNLSNFCLVTADVLTDLTLILSGSVVEGVSEIVFNLLTLNVLCFVHGLPHKASRDLFNAFDTLSASLPSNPLFQKANMLFKDTIGFKLLGYSYDLKLLASVRYQFKSLKD